MTGIGANGAVHLTKISCVRDHRADGVAGLVSVVGVRFTTARRTAQDAVDLLGRLLERVLPSSRSATTPLAGGEIADLGSFLNEAQRAMSPFQRADVDRIARSYGTAYPRVLRTIASNPAHSSPLSDSCPVTRGEVLYAAREEMGVRLADVLLRRTEAGSAEHPGRDAVESAAALLAAEHGWDRARVAAEIELVDARFTMAPMS
jgi:glycerol-3-phosphate dehydrogenase